MILPFAVGPLNDSGIAEFRVNSNAGCSSMLPAVKSSGRRWCTRPKEHRQVPSVTLERVLRWVNRTVDFVKIDAQASWRSSRFSLCV